MKNLLEESKKSLAQYKRAQESELVEATSSFYIWDETFRAASLLDERAFAKEISGPIRQQVIRNIGDIKGMVELRADIDSSGRDRVKIFINDVDEKTRNDAKAALAKIMKTYFPSL